jgi:hypothetical protein
MIVSLFMGIVAWYLGIRNKNKTKQRLFIVCSPCREEEEEEISN